MQHGFKAFLPGGRAQLFPQLIGRDIEFWQRADSEETVRIIVIPDGPCQSQHVARHGCFQHVEPDHDERNVPRRQLRHQVFPLHVLAVQHCHGAVTRTLVPAQLLNLFTNQRSLAFMAIGKNNLHRFVKNKAAFLLVTAVASQIQAARAGTLPGLPAIALADFH